jgi:hypothetical protein
MLRRTVALVVAFIAAFFALPAADASPPDATKQSLVCVYASPAHDLPINHTKLALPPNRALPDAAIRIDLAGLRKAGYEIPTPTRVSSTVTGAGGRTYSMPGGGYEMQFPYSIPP